MSDCSTQAMQPKEPPKTSPFPNGLWPNRGDCHTCAKTGHCEYEQFGERIVTARCDYKPSAYHTLEKRYQQLEQVAREMYDWADGVVNRCYTVVPERVDGFRTRLEALGVNLDD